MSIAVAARPVSAALDDTGPRWVIVDHVARGALRWAMIWGGIFGLWVLSTTKAYMSGYPTFAARIELTHSLSAFSVFLGQPYHAETVAGFTTWRLLVVGVTIGAVWGLMTSTGLLRGEEEAGRWELLLAGRTTKRRAAVEALIGLGIAQLTMYLVLLVATFGVVRLTRAPFSPGSTMLFAAAMVSGAAMFLAIGAVASQLSATRGQAAMLSAGVLVASFVVRMIADSKSNLGWMRWLSPIGWLEELHPLQTPQWIAVVPVLALIAGCVWLTVTLAGRRDLGASVLHERPERAGGDSWLTGPVSLAIRLVLPSATAWLGGIAGMGWLYGSLARSAASLLNSSPTFTAVLSRLGVRQAALGYLGIIFLMLGVLISVIAAGQIVAMRDEEASGRLDNLLVRPVHRLAWLASRFVVSTALIVLAGIVAGFGAWIGASGEHLGVSLQTLIAAGLNVTVPALFVLGAGMFVLGFRPRLSATAVYGIVAWSFLIDLVGSLLKGGKWLRDTSLFSHIALAPAANPDWLTNFVIVLIGAGLAILGVLAYLKRDIVSE